MRKIIEVQIFAVLLAVCLAGCSFIGIPQDTTEPTQTPAQSVESTATTATSPSTEPMQSETLRPQPIIQPEPNAEDFVKVQAYIPNVEVELRYATENNFTNQQIYDFTDAWLRYGTVRKLMSVQEELKQYGYRLKIWDGFRPPAAQFKLWKVCPDPTYVSNPNDGFSSHSRGNTVDVTLVHEDGTELSMPTGFDDFSKLADRDYSDCGAEEATNALLLERLMEKYGFKPYYGEWWHFTDTQSYPVDESFEPTEAALYYADCNEYISLRTKPSTDAEVITRILVGEQVTMVAKTGDFALVEYDGLFGYVLYGYLKPAD